MQQRKPLYSLSLVACMLLVGGCSAPKTPTTTNTVQINESTTPTPSPTPFITRINMQALTSELQARIDQEKNNQPNIVVGVAIEDYLTGDTLEINASETFDAASIGKLPILMLLYDQIKDGKVSESETITINENNVERYGTGSIQYQKLPKEYTITELARLMINVSDNTASSVLATKIGRNNLSTYVKEKEMLGTDTRENDTIPYDTMILLRELYQRRIAGDKLADKMLEYMTDTAFENRLAEPIPEDIQIAHKIGTQTGQFHDAGIVFHPKRPYGISIYTKNAVNETLTLKCISDLSKITFDHIQKQSTK